MKKQLLALKQLDKQLASWQKAKAFFQPSHGWIRTLRKVLGMTTQQLSKHLGIDRSRLVRIESAEIADAVTLRTLRKAAHALNCDLVYGFVPRIPLKEWIHEQALNIAKERLKTVAHSMALEDQAVNADEQKEQLDEMVKTLLQESFKHLWR